ncbi:FkbM family methyltransferase [Methylosinus sp. Sm6]|uniref:FkbM family methyltransferase n=1 Tax=Methylosinus sp. Sm6 TaxID=2866948 RepID=UPI001C994506|nr:FkbM family methyltransferase [Methylosinus sp. Sm6]MBY6243608.1 FkbM family methyltransferase [Methylosinus sp. Sm6]
MSRKLHRSDEHAIVTKKYSRKELFSSFTGYLLHLLLERRAIAHLSDGRPRLAIYSYDYISNSINIDGLYERALLDIIFKYLESIPNIFDGNALDIGANIGNHSIYFSYYFKNVICFEANPQTFDILSINAKLRNNIVCHNFALSRSSGQGTLKIDPTNMGSASLYSEGASVVPNIPLERLDAFEGEVGKVSLIKIDVQRAELDVLLGGERLIKKMTPVILFEQELAEIENGASACIELLRKFGYDKFLVTEDRPIVPFAANPGTIPSLLARLYAVLFGKTTVLKECDHFLKKRYSIIVAVHKDSRKSPL